MKWPLLAIAALSVFLVALIAGMPARLLYDAWLRPDGIAAYAVTGTVWQADLYETVVAGRRIARIKAGLDPLALLSGRLQARMQLSDPAVQLDATVTRSAMTWSVESLSGAIVVRPAAGSGLVVPAGETRLYVDDLNARFGASGCEAADGQARTLALAIVGDRLGLDLPVLSGDFGCAGQRLVLRLAGQSETVALHGWIRFAPTDADWSLEAEATAGEARQALAALGFVEENDRWRIHGTQSWGAR